MRAISHAAMAKGASAVMIAPPPSLRTDDQIVAHYAQAVEAIGADIPFVIQDYPLALGVIMTPNVIRRIITDNHSCVMLKHEDWPGLEKISSLRRFEQEGKLRRVPILSGNGGLFLDFEMERGVDGAMTGYAFPEMLIDVVRLSSEGGATKRTTFSTPTCRSSVRATAGRRPGHPQICDDAARHSCLGRATQARRRPQRDGEGGSGLSASAPCAP
jgi:dihydrodipicolinate synthase/N-acetylneuraminate lyase